MKSNWLYVLFAYLLWLAAGTFALLSINVKDALDGDGSITLYFNNYGEGPFELWLFRLFALACFSSGIVCLKWFADTVRSDDS